VAATSSAAHGTLADVDDGIAPEARSRGILLRPRPARRLGLRARIMLAFGLGALFLSLLLAGTTYALTRQNLLEQREESALTAAYFNARRVQGSLPSEPEDIRATLASLAAPNPIVYQDGVYFPIQAGRNEEDLPPALREAVIVGGQAVQMSFDLDGEPFLAIGIPLPQVEGSNAVYFELVVLTETADTLGPAVLAVKAEM